MSVLEALRLQDRIFFNNVSGFPGQDQDIGTPSKPSGVESDALAMMVARQINKIEAVDAGAFSFPLGVNVDFVGNGMFDVTVLPGLTVNFRNGLKCRNFTNGAGSTTVFNGDLVLTGTLTNDGAVSLTIDGDCKCVVDIISNTTGIFICSGQLTAQSFEQLDPTNTGEITIGGDVFIQNLLYLNGFKKAELLGNAYVGGDAILTDGTGSGIKIHGNFVCANLDNTGLLAPLVVRGGCIVTHDFTIDVSVTTIIGKLTVGGDITFAANGSLTAGGITCENNYNAQFDGVTIICKGDFWDGNGTQLGGGTSGLMAIYGNYYSNSTAIAAGATLIVLDHAEPGALTNAGTFTYGLGTQPEQQVNVMAIVGGVDIINLATAGYHYDVKKLRIKCDNPGADFVTINLWEMINGVLTIVDSFIITLAGPNPWTDYYSLVDMFGLDHLSGDNLKVDAVASANTYAVTGSYVYEVS